MSELTEFLLARIAEDRAIAAAASDPSWTWVEAYDGDAYTEIVDGTGRTVVNNSPLNEDEAAHIARWDPKRALDECEAKRRTVELADEATGLDAQVDGEFRVEPRDTESEPYVGDLILRALASVYADHDEFREEWR